MILEHGQEVGLRVIWERMCACVVCAEETGHGSGGKQSKGSARDNQQPTRMAFFIKPVHLSKLLLSRCSSGGFFLIIEEEEEEEEDSGTSAAVAWLLLLLSLFSVSGDTPRGREFSWEVSRSMESNPDESWTVRIAGC